MRLRQNPSVDKLGTDHIERDTKPHQCYLQQNLNTNRPVIVVISPAIIVSVVRLILPGVGLVLSPVRVAGVARRSLLVKPTFVVLVVMVAGMRKMRIILS